MLKRQHTTPGYLGAPVKIPDGVSNTIKVARVWCIYFMMLVHVNPGFSPSSTTNMESGDAVFLVRSVFSGLLGRASVPLLSVISGYLAVKTLSNRNVQDYIVARFKVLVMPLVFWNLAGLTIGFLAFKATGSMTDAYFGVEGRNSLKHVFSSVLAIDYQSYNMALNFLRDLFVVSLLAPVLLFGAKRFPKSSTAAIFLIGGFFSFYPIIYRPHILMFFQLGLVAAAHPKVLKRVTERSYLAKIAFGLTFVAYLLLAYSLLPQSLLSVGSFEWFELVMRATTSLFTWHLCRRIAESTNTVSDIFRRYSRDIYIAYLSHMLIFGLAWTALWKPVFGEETTNPAYLAFYFLMPLAVIATAPVIRRSMSSLPAVVNYFVTGKAASKDRTRSTRRTSPVAPLPFRPYNR